jgi:SAM-dependent methyltransferase
MSRDERLMAGRFPRASRYNPDWVLAGVSGAANPLWMTEWLAEAMDLRPGMRVLDLGCGRALSSVFLRRELGVEVWATDLWFRPSENFTRASDAGVAEGVFPVHANARALPFADAFFDAVVSIDSFPYYGTDDLYLNYIARFLTPDGQLGIAGVGLIHELEGVVPEHLHGWWTSDLWCLHSAAWWRRHWWQTRIVTIETADTLPDGWRLWVDWLRLVAPENVTEIGALEADAGRVLGYVRVVGRRRADAPLVDLDIVSVPTEYRKHPLLRDGSDDA